MCHCDIILDIKIQGKGSVFKFGELLKLSGVIIGKISFRFGVFYLVKSQKSRSTLAEI